MLGKCFLLLVYIVHQVSKIIWTGLPEGKAHFSKVFLNLHCHGFRENGQEGLPVVKGLNSPPEIDIVSSQGAGVLM